MTECEKAAMEMAIDTMHRNLGRYMNRGHYNPTTKLRVSYPEAIGILERMLDLAEQNEKENVKC